MPPINKDHALTIAKKLGATIDKKGKAHDIAIIRHNGALIATFGIRRGSNKNQPHGHIPGSLHLSPRKTLEMAICRITLKQWLKTLVDLELIDDPGDLDEG